MNKGFGRPRPLPGQRGYKKQRESERLDVQAKQIEDRLIKLRARMKMQKDTGTSIREIEKKTRQNVYRSHTQHSHENWRMGFF